MFFVGNVGPVKRIMHEKCEQARSITDVAAKVDKTRLMTHDVKNRGEKTQDQSTTILQIYSTENREKRLKKNDKQVAQHCCDMDEALNLKPGTVSTNSDGFLR